MNPLQDKIRELDAERDQLQKENRLHKQTITVINAYLKNVPATAKPFEILHDLNQIIEKHKSLTK